MQKNRPETRTNAARTQNAARKRPRAKNSANIAPTHRQNGGSVSRAGLPLKHVRTALMLYLKHIGLTRLGTDSGAADFLRSARPAEAAIAKVFAKISQKVLFCIIFWTRRTHGDIENYQLSKFQP